MKTGIFTLAILFLALLSGCHNKDLCPECEQETGIEIKFDWSKVSQVPTGMTVLLYTPEGKPAYSFNDISPQGEMVRIDAGTYQVACYNNDSEYARWSGQETPDSLQVTMREGTLTEDHTRSASDPETGTLMVMPDFLCGQVRRQVTIKADEPGIQVILLTPVPLIDTYTYEISDIENTQYITQIRATLSSLSDRYYLADPAHQVAAATMPFMGNISIENQQMVEGDMLNLGYFKKDAARNYLTLYLWTQGGNLRATFDVTDQVHNAPDPHHVNIVIHTHIVIPPPIAGDDGVDPSVDQWKDVDIDIIL